jgi:hypothetical protein
MHLGSLGNEDGDLLMGTSHSSYLPYCYLDGDPYVSGEGGLSGGAGTHGQVKLWVLVVQIFSLAPL